MDGPWWGALVGRVLGLIWSGWPTGRPRCEAMSGCRTLSPLQGCVNPGGSLSLSESQLLHLYNGNNNIYLTTHCGTLVLTNGCGT